MIKKKLKSAVHLGRVSAQKRREKLGERGFKKSMKALRKMGAQKSVLSTRHESS